MIMQKWKQENVFRDHVDMDPNHVQLKIVMLGKLCGAVIGENGKTINDIKIATHTDIRVQVCGLSLFFFRCCALPIGSQRKPAELSLQGSAEWTAWE